MPGEPDLYVRARRALLDAADALEAHLDAVVLVGAQAIYLHAGEADLLDRSIAHNSGVGPAGGAVTVSAAATVSEI